MSKRLFSLEIIYNYFTLHIQNLPAGNADSVPGVYTKQFVAAF